LIAPTHFTRVPRPVNLTAASDTTVTGKRQIELQWSVNSEENLKDFSVSRAFQINPASKITFSTVVLNYTKTTYVDSAIINFSDSLMVFYYIQPRGIDTFAGENSDTVKITLIK
ncbi:MAG: hypothetical protein K8H86_01010, partial [Ignavibacteriaceae bacterium]|nr:hypothetical protein [Ignavibacteriaceae bacterium]